jgi:two-component system cell cycle response regulator DivK
MDLQLPGIDGTEALRQIQQQAGERMMPVVAVTASAMPSDREAAARAGFDGFLEKPINVRALPAQVASYLTGSP